MGKFATLPVCHCWAIDITFSGPCLVAGILLPRTVASVVAFFLFLPVVLEHQCTNVVTWCVSVKPDVASSITHCPQSLFLAGEGDQ